MNRTDDTRARLDAAHAEVPYEVEDRHETASRAWSTLYQYAPSDLTHLLNEVERHKRNYILALEERDALAAKVARVEAALIGMEAMYHRIDVACPVDGDDH